MQRFLYPAVFYKVDDEYKVLFPDINLATEGVVMEEAYLFASEFLKAYLAYALKYDLDYNLPTDYESISKKLNKDETCMLIDVSLTDKDIAGSKKK